MEWYLAVTFRAWVAMGFGRFWEKEKMRIVSLLRLGGI